MPVSPCPLEHDSCRFRMKMSTQVEPPMGTATDHTRASNPTDPTDPSPRGPVRRPVPRRISLDFASAPDLPRLRTRVRRVPRPCAGFRPTACLGYAVAPNPAHYRRRRPESGAHFTQSSRIRHRADAVAPNPAHVVESPFRGRPRAESPCPSRQKGGLGEKRREKRGTRGGHALGTRTREGRALGTRTREGCRPEHTDSRSTRARDGDSALRTAAQDGGSAKQPGRGPTAGRPLGQHMVVWWSAATSPERATGSEHAVYLGIRTTADSLL